MANGTMISKADAQTLVNRFRSQPQDCNANVKGMRYDLAMIEQLKEAAPDGVEITSVRIYFGMNEDSSLCTVLIGCDAEGNNYYGAGDHMCLDQGTPCPDDCGSNPL